MDVLIYSLCALLLAACFVFMCLFAFIMFDMWKQNRDE